MQTLHAFSAPRVRTERQVAGRRAHLICRSAVTALPNVETSTSSATSAKIYFRTSWSKAWLHGSVAGSSWKDIPLNQVPSAPGQWLVADVDVGADAASGKPLMEFVVTDKQNNWDKPSQGGNYLVTGPGRYQVRDGRLQPVAGPPVMVVSDLDGTMVGDDNATAAFRSFWHDVGVVRGGVLVYNTGRALQAFEQLRREKAHCLAHPDALISAVGTKIYRCQGGGWIEDAAWSSTLDEAWDVNVVREAGYKALAMVGKDLMHFRPPEEQNDHKVTCGVHVSTLDKVLSCVRESLTAGGVTANIITSGSGDWRYLDLVPIKAGKLEALEYVRKLYGFPVGSTVACGDSGNDILMLAGQNPAIVVGNAQPDLVRWVEEQRKKEPAVGSDGKQRLFVASKHEAFGILEGLQHLGLK